MLKSRLRDRASGILTYGITPPRREYDDEKKREIAAKQIERVRSLPVDGLVIYDLQDESARTSEERPFPFLPTLDSSEYAGEYLAELETPKIVYRCVGKYDADELTRGLNELDENSCSVFVGPASRNQATRLTLVQAYELRREVKPELVLGAVTIPERHMASNREHLNVARKIESGVSFFISQAVYNAEASRNFLSDYHYHCLEQGLEPAPILLTITPCGSARTLEFMKWLGISFPRWLENDLKHTSDILADSVEHCLRIFKELHAFGSARNIPIGCNVESVSIRKAEIDAAGEITRLIHDYLRKS